MKFKGKELTPEQLVIGMNCESPEQFREVCANINIELTEEEAEMYFDELDDVDLSPEEMQAIAGGKIWGKEYDIIDYIKMTTKITKKVINHFC